jgi:hypothetical protein
MQRTAQLRLLMVCLPTACLLMAPLRLKAATLPSLHLLNNLSV